MAADTSIRIPLHKLQGRPASIVLLSQHESSVEIDVPARGGLARDLRGPHTDVH